MFAKKFCKGIRIQREWVMNFKNTLNIVFFHGGNTVLFLKMVSVKVVAYLQTFCYGISY